MGAGHLLSVKNLVNEPQGVLRETILCRFHLNFPNALRSRASKGRYAPLARLLLSSPSLTVAPLRACAWHAGMKYSVAQLWGRKSTPGREIRPQLTANECRSSGDARQAEGEGANGNHCIFGTHEVLGSVKWQYNETSETFGRTCAVAIS